MITVLLLSAEHKEDRPLNLGEEFKRIMAVHRSSTYRDQFSIEQRPAATYDNLIGAISEFKGTPLIIHFCGHGMGENGLVFVKDNGEKETISTETLANLFNISHKHDRNIVGVILNACYAEWQANEISKYVKYVIGMSHEVKDEHAIYFAEQFYKSLFEKDRVEKAFDLGCHSIRRYSNNPNSLYRAVYDPAPNDKIASPLIFDYDIPRLIVNKNLEDINNLDGGLSRPKRIISYQQWNALQLILLEIDFEILKNVCRDTLNKDIKDIEPKILSLKKLVDLEKLLLEQYPIHKDSDTITILNFSNRLRIEEEVADSQKIEIKSWLEKIAKEKEIDLPNLLQNAEPQISLSKAILKSYLLISIIENPGTSSTFSLEAELIANYQEGEPYDYDKDKPIPITSKQEGVNAISLNQIAPCIRDLISIAIKQLSVKHNLTIELFVPFDYLGEHFDIYGIIPIGSRRTNTVRIGSLYPIIIRCLDRYQEKNLFNELEKRWDGIREYLSKDKEYLEKKCAYLESLNQNWDDLYRRWQSDDFFSINLIDELPIDEEEKEAYFDGFQLSGIPISLWSRSPKVKYEVNARDCNVKEKFKDILAIESFKSLGEIFKRIYQLRKDAPSDQNKAQDYLGYHLGFICDHPYRIPFNLRERLNQRGLQGSN